ncbi:MAG: hypothetical protein HC869_01695 [Rhodospirillales bacterium]|nr:hypothetical protein [Rhodospirillales bacterium]
MGKLAPHTAFLVEIIGAEPDITLAELAGTHGLRVELSSIHRALVRAGLTYKKRADRTGAGPRGAEGGPA